MSFTIDKQTLDDLNILGQRGNNSIYNIFNQTNTKGGADLLEQIFMYPLGDHESISKRSSTIRYFQNLNSGFPFKSELFDLVEQYLSNTDTRNTLDEENNVFNKKLRNLIGADTEYQHLVNGVKSTLELLDQLKIFMLTIEQVPPIEGVSSEILQIKTVISDPEFKVVFGRKINEKLPPESISKLDKLFRYVHRDKVKRILYYIYLLDVYISVASVGKAKGFNFPETLADQQHSLEIINVYHPHLKNAVANSICLTPKENIVFLTGANMAGKSTFMKSIGICIYLAHLGFPVPAEKMEFSVLDGIFTTINLPDNLNTGTSHFYAEVLRIKKIAIQLANDKNLFVIIDELFRGTNVKDAYEATILITEAFAKKRNSMFVISTHIIEAGEELKERCDNIRFSYLPTKMEQNNPVYTYKVEQGITEDRHGMVIINNEGILEILRRRKNA